MLNGHRETPERTEGVGIIVNKTECDCQVHFMWQRQKVLDNMDHCGSCQTSEPPEVSSILPELRLK